MATDFTGSPAREDAAATLASLRADRGEIAGRLDAARWFPLGMGVVAGLFVTTPTVPDGGPRTTVLVLVLILSIVLVDRFRRGTGVRLAGLGLPAAALAAVALVVSLVLLSVAFGLVAADLAPWVAVCAATALVAVAWLARRSLAAVKEHLGRGL